jgi:hypothetical protein
MAAKRSSERQLLLATINQAQPQPQARQPADLLCNAKQRNASARSLEQQKRHRESLRRCVCLAEAGQSRSHSPRQAIDQVLCERPLFGDGSRDLHGAQCGRQSSPPSPAMAGAGFGLAAYLSLLSASIVRHRQRNAKRARPQPEPEPAKLMSCLQQQQTRARPRLLWRQSIRLGPAGRQLCRREKQKRSNQTAWPVHWQAT